MPKTVTVPGVGDVDFPDGMSDADISEAIRTKILPAAASQKPGNISPPKSDSPAAARVANVVAARGGNPEEHPWLDALDYVGAGLKAVGGLLPDFSSDPGGIQYTAGVVRTAAEHMAKHPGATGERQAIVSAVPIVGEPLAELAEPSIAYSEGRAPTHEENVSAVEGGAALAALALAPKVMNKLSKAANARVENVMRARGATPEAAAPVETRTPGAKANAQVDKLNASESLDDFIARRFPGATLGAAETVNPEAFEMHIDNANPLPKVEDVTAAAKKLAPVKEFMDGVNPAGASEGAAAAADILRDSKATIANDAAIERVRNEDIAKTFDRAGDEKNIENISNFERTGRFMAGDHFPDQASADAYSKMYQESTDVAHETLRQVYGDDRVGYVDNYVRRAFRFGTEADEAKATGVLSNYVGSLSASQSPLKGRVLSVPLDEALQQMRTAGIDVEPATTNPEILRQWTVENANQARVYKQAWDDAKAGDLIQFVKQGDRVPQGMVQLNDRVAQVFRPTEEGPVRTGQYFAEPGVARVFNNAISKGLGGSPTFQAIRAVNNAYNQMQLGLSGFHLTGTAINAGISDLSLGLHQILRGDIGAAAKNIGRSSVPGYSFTRDMLRGREFVNDLIADDPAARQVLEEKFNPAGGRLAIDQAYRNSAYENMVKAWSNGRYIRALGNVPFAVVQKIASPLMEYAIPRVKIGAFMDLADAERAKLGPNATPTEIQRAYERAWDSIDNRFGQVVHDNLFWNRTAADLAQVATRSVGWNLGTIREIGGGAVDLAKGNVSARALYSLALPIYAGTIGAVFHYLHTGKRPETLRDLYYPQNGLTDNKGRPDRASLPTYMKDVVAYSTDPVSTLEHKASPLLSLAFDLGTNRDYYGDMIRNPEETRSKQLLQMGSYALRQFRPFSVQQAAKTMAEGGPPRAAEQMMGFPSAPASMKQTAEESQNFKEARRLRNENAMNAAERRHGVSYRRLGDQIEFPVRGRDENDGLFMKRTDASGKLLRFPVPARLSDFLPAQFKHARAVLYGAPLSGEIQSGSHATKDVQGAYGRPFGTQQDSNTVLIARNATDEPGVTAHEVNHAIYLHDLTPEQRQTFDAKVTDALRPAIEAIRAGKPVPAHTFDGVPKAVQLYGWEYRNSPRNAFNESFAELGAQYMLNPTAFKAKYPDWYAMIKSFYGGKEYIAAHKRAS